MEFPEYKINLVPLTKEAEAAQGFEWAGETAGTRSKIGGKPEFIQDEIRPRCCHCDCEMRFLMQLDSIGDEFEFADVGIIYTYICQDCWEVRSFIQSG